MNLLNAPQGDFVLNRFPSRKKTSGKKENLRAWDAADEYLLHHLAESKLLTEKSSLLIVNDNFGGLAVVLNQYQPVVMTDSYLAMQAIKNNLSSNNLDEDSLTLINSLQAPADFLTDAATVVIIKIPKSLAMLEDQLHRIRPALNSETKIIAAGMTKNIHMSVMALFEKIIGSTTTSLARKKARLIFSQFEKTLTLAENPYPQSYDSGYQLEGNALALLNHASVFSREKLDVGTQLLLQNMPIAEHYKSIVDLGCGNGVLGLIAALKNPVAKMVFTDESYMAVESAIANFLAVFGETREAEFLQTDCLQGVEENSVSLILCNPPFHRNNVVSDVVAWQMFTESKLTLENKGELWVIGNRHLAYHAKLKHLFGHCNVIASNKKFTLLKATKN